MGELPLRGAARSEEGQVGSNWGSFCCAGLLDGGNGGGGTWGSFRCAGLLHGGMEEAAAFGVSLEHTSTVRVQVLCTAVQ